MCLPPEPAETGHSGLTTTASGFRTYTGQTDSGISIPFWLLRNAQKKKKKLNNRNNKKKKKKNINNHNNKTDRELFPFICYTF